MRKSTLLLACVLSALACERDTGIVSSEVISGYRIDGRVVDRIGNPVKNVDVKVFYNYEYVDYNSPPSKEYDVPDPSPTVTVVVRNRNGQNIRTLYSGNPPPGPFLVEWDKKDADSVDAPSGVYSVHYLVNNTTQKSYDIAVEGTLVARSDSLGKYVIPNDNLPVGFYPVPLYNADKTLFYGNHRISSSILLLFSTSARYREVYITVVKDRVTVLDVVFG